MILENNFMHRVGLRRNVSLNLSNLFAICKKIVMFVATAAVYIQLILLSKVA